MRATWVFTVAGEMWMIRAICGLEHPSETRESTRSSCEGRGLLRFWFASSRLHSGQLFGVTSLAEPDDLQRGIVVLNVELDCRGVALQLPDPSKLSYRGEVAVVDLLLPPGKPGVEAR